MAASSYNYLSILINIHQSNECLLSCRWDRARGYEIGNKDIELEYIEEAFTSQNWIVRIYKVKDLDNRW